MDKLTAIVSKLCTEQHPGAIVQGMVWHCLVYHVMLLYNTDDVRPSSPSQQASMDAEKTTDDDGSKETGIDEVDARVPSRKGPIVYMQQFVESKGSLRVLEFVRADQRADPL